MCLFHLLLKNLSLYGDVTTSGKGLHNLDICWTLRAFEQGVVFILPRLLLHGASIFLKDHPIYIMYGTQGFLHGFQQGFLSDINKEYVIK
jgi:hypothetical protein